MSPFSTVNTGTGHCHLFPQSVLVPGIVIFSQSMLVPGIFTFCHSQYWYQALSPFLAVNAGTRHWHLFPVNAGTRHCHLFPQSTLVPGIVTFSHSQCWYQALSSFPCLVAKSVWANTLLTLCHTVPTYNALGENSFENTVLKKEHAGNQDFLYFPALNFDELTCLLCSRELNKGHHFEQLKAL